MVACELMHLIDLHLLHQGGSNRFELAERVQKGFSLF